MFELVGDNKKIYYWIYDSDEYKSDEILKKVEEIVRGCNDIKYNFSGVTSSNDETLSDFNKYKSKKLQRHVKDEICQLLISMENKLIGCKKSASECIEKNDKFSYNIELLRKILPDTNDFEQPIELFDLEPLEKLLKKGLTHYFHLREISKDKILKNKSEGEVKSSLSRLPSGNIAKTVDLGNHGEQVQNQSGNLKENINKKDTENNYLGFDKKSSTEFTKIESSNKNKIN